MSESPWGARPTRSETGVRDSSATPETREDCRKTDWPPDGHRQAPCSGGRAVSEAVQVRLPRHHRPSDHDAAGRAARAMKLPQERMTRRPSGLAERATDREVGVVASFLVAGSEREAAHRVGPVALDRRAPPRERAVEGGSDAHGAARVDPRPAAAGARGFRRRPTRVMVGPPRQANLRFASRWTTLSRACATRRGRSHGEITGWLGRVGRDRRCRRHRVPGSSRRAGQPQGGRARCARDPGLGAGR